MENYSETESVSVKILNSGAMISDAAAMNFTASDEMVGSTVNSGGNSVVFAEDFREYSILRKTYENTMFVIDISSIGTATSPLIDSISSCGEFLAIEVGTHANRGSYAIGGKADNFKQSIALFADNKNAGSLQIGAAPLKYGNCIYSLRLTGNILYLDVDYVHNSNDVRLQENTNGGWSVKQSDSSMEKLSVAAGQILDADRGGVLDNIVINGGAVRVREGALAKNTVINAGEMSAGNGYAENTTLNNGYLTATDGGIILNTTVNGGVVITRNNAIASSNTVKAGAIEVCSGGKLQDTTLLSGTMLRTYASGSAVNTKISSGATVFAEKDGLLRKAAVFSGATVAVSSGGHAENISVQEGGAVYLSGGATVSDLYFADSHTRLRFGVNSDTNIHFISGNQACRVRNGNLSGFTADVNTYVDIYDGGVASKLYTTGCIEPINNGAGGVFQIFNGGKAFDVENHASGQINVFSGGYLSGAKTDTEGEIYLSGGYAVDLDAYENGYIWVHSDGIASDIKLFDNGKLTVSSGGSVHDLKIFNGHAIIEEPNAYLTDAVIYNNGILEVCGASATDIIISSGGLMTFSDEFKQMGSSWKDSPNGQGYNITVCNGGVLAVRQTGSATDVTLNSGAQLQVWSDSEVIDLVALNETYTVMSGGRLVGADIQSGARLDILSGAMVSDLKIADGAEIILDFFRDMTFNGSYNGKAFSTKNNILSDFTVSGDANFYAGTGAKNIVINSFGRVNAHAKSLVDGINVKADATFYAFAEASVKNMVTGGNAYICSGAVAEDVTAAAGYLTIFEGANVSELDVENGGVIIAGKVEEIEMSGNEGRVQLDNGAIVEEISIDAGFITINAGTTVSELEISGGGAIINAGANIQELQVSSGGVSINGGKVSNITLSGADGNITLAAEAENIKVKNGYITVNAGAKVNGLEVSNGGAIINGGKVSGITLSGADGRITLAAEAENIKVKNGYITVNTGAKVNGLEVSNGGAIINGGKVSGIILSGADGRISLSAEAENIKVTNGYITITSGANVNGLHVSNGGSLIYGGYISDLQLSSTAAALVGGGTTVRNISLSGSQCSLTIQAGASITGKIDLTQGMVSADADSKVIFDLSQDFAISGESVLVAGYEYVAQSDIVISVISELESGIYKLASSSNSMLFESVSASLMVNNVSCGTLSTGSTISVSDKSYTLSMDGNRDLVLEIAQLEYSNWESETLPASIVLETDDIAPAYNGFDVFDEYTAPLQQTADLCFIGCSTQYDLFEKNKTLCDAALA